MEVHSQRWDHERQRKGVDFCTYIDGQNGYLNHVIATWARNCFYPACLHQDTYADTAKAKGMGEFEW
jgi:hypothetical protein